MSSINDFSPPSQPHFPSVPMSPEGGLIIYRLIQQDFCETPNRPILKAVNHVSRQVVYFKPLCKSWSCPYCAPRRATRWQIHAVHGASVLSTVGAVDFVTITSHEKLTAAASLAVLPKAWNKLNRRVKRAAGAAEYFAVPEQHQSGRWHLHAIVSVHLKKRWWKDNARACGLGYQSDVQEVHNLGGVGAYVSKYLTKTLETSNLPKGFRRVRLSHGWPRQPNPEQPSDWTFLSVPKNAQLSDEAARQQSAGYTVVMADGVSAWDWLATWGAVDED